VEIDAIERVAGRVTAVGGGGRTFSGDQFVIAGGVWSPGLVRGLGLRLPLQAGKGYSLTLGDPAQVPQLCSILTEARVAVTPMGGRLRFARDDGDWRPRDEERSPPGARDRALGAGVFSGVPGGGFCQHAAVGRAAAGVAGRGFPTWGRRRGLRTWWWRPGTGCWG
jgi:hypothetical protein